MSTFAAIASVVLMEWLLIAAEITDQFQYYLWAFLVVVLWSETVHAREPNLYPNRLMRIALFSVYYFSFLLMNKSVLWIREFGLPLPESSSGDGWARGVIRLLLQLARGYGRFTAS